MSPLQSSQDIGINDDSEMCTVQKTTMTRLQSNFTKVQVSNKGNHIITIPKKIVEYNKITKGCVIKWRESFGFPIIERIIYPEKNIERRTDHGIIYKEKKRN